MRKLLLLLTSFLFTSSLMAQVTAINVSNPQCFGMCNGAVTLSITGGTPPYTISTPGGPSSCTIATMSNVTTNTITVFNLCACFYNFVVTDAMLNVIGVAPVTLTSPPPIQITFSVQNVCCNGQCNGSITPFVTGGSPPYVYNWFPNNPTSNACAGTYDLCVTDGNGCSKCQVATITQPAPFSITSSVTAASCGTCCNGVVNVNGTGGTAPYSYTVYPGNTTSSSGTFSNMCVGSYSICGSDNGCCMTCIGVTVPSSTGIKTLASKGDEIFIYPNPSHGTLYLRSLVELTGATFEVHDLLGKKIESGEAEELSKMNPLQDGVYFITIRNKDCTVISRKKIIIER